MEMPVFSERSNDPHNLVHVDCNDSFENHNLNDQVENCEDDELLTVHFGDVATPCPREEIIVDSEEESSEVNLFLCSVCAMVCDSLNSLKEHESLHSKGNEMCTTHTEAEIDEDVMYVCSVCTVVYGDLQSLKEHERTHADEIRTKQTETEMDQDIMFVCSVCTVVCENLESLKQHEKIHSKGVTQTYSQNQNTVYREAQDCENSMFMCNVCTVVCGDMQLLKQHIMTHSEDMRTLYSGGGNTHVSVAEINKDNMFMCSICTMVCENSLSLKHHEISHSGEERLAFYEPENRVLSEAEFNEDGNYVCKICFLVFTNLQSLSQHESLHLDDRPYKCSLCNYAGKLKENLIAHMNTHTREKQFRCLHCDFTSLKPHSLKLHLQFHTNKYPNKCSVCLYSTASLSSLASHYRNHHHKISEQINAKKLAISKSGSEHSPRLDFGMTKCYKCQYCDYSTKKSYSLKRHLQAHTDKFPNKCHLCLYSTANPGNLTSHYKNHHRNNTEDQNIRTEDQNTRTEDQNTRTEDQNTREEGQSRCVEGQSTYMEEIETSDVNSDTCFEDVSSEFESLDKPYKCQYCDYSASKPYKIRNHMEHHTDAFPNKCRLCVYSTARSGHLLYHYKYHHQASGDSVAMSAAAKHSEPVVDKCEQVPNWMNIFTERERTFRCDQCEYTATKPHRVREHSLHHNYDYQCKCPWCVYSTANQANLNYHCRNHHRSITERNDFQSLEGDRNSSLENRLINDFELAEAHSNNSLKYKLKNLTIPLERLHEFTNCFVCDICQKMFMERSLLMEHKKTHLEICHYNCDVCECSFCDSELLETHKMSHEKEEINQFADFSEIRNSDLLCKIKLTAMKSNPAMKSMLHRIKNMPSKFQRKNRKILRTSSLQINADKQRCKLVLHKLDKSNTSKIKIDYQTGIANGDIIESSVIISESSKDQPATEVPQYHDRGLSLKNCTVQIKSTEQETLRKIQLFRCLLCQFAGKSSESLKIHTDSHHKGEVTLKSHREFNHKKESSNTADVTLILQNKSSRRETADLKSHKSTCQKELSLLLDTESKQKKKYSCSICKHTCRNIQNFERHMVKHDLADGQNSQFGEEAKIATELHCDKCDFSCDQQALLHQHLSVHGGGKDALPHHLPENEEDIASGSQRPVFYKCVLCSRKSLDIESMTKHMLTCNTKKGLW